MVPPYLGNSAPGVSLITKLPFVDATVFSVAPDGGLIVLEGALRDGVLGIV